MTIKIVNREFIKKASKVRNKNSKKTLEESSIIIDGLDYPVFNSIPEELNVKNAKEGDFLQVAGFPKNTTKKSQKFYFMGFVGEDVKTINGEGLTHHFIVDAVALRKIKKSR